MLAFSGPSVTVAAEPIVPACASVVITVDAPGLSPETIERDITIPLERALGWIPDLGRMSSNTWQGRSTIYLGFPMAPRTPTDAHDPIDTVRAAVREAVSAVALDGRVPDIAVDSRARNDACAACDRSTTSLTPGTQSCG